MLNLKTLMISLFLLLSAPNLIAGAGHSHGPIDQQTAELRSDRIVDSLMQRGVIPNSWQQRKQGKVSKIKRNGTWLWQAEFDAVDNTVKQKRLFIFLSQTGNFMEANFSGK